jgi:hypothetical protein
MRIRFAGCLAALAIAAAPLSGQGIISTVAGGNGCTGTGEGGPAVGTCLSALGLLAIDRQGNLYFWMGGIPSIQKVNMTTGIISTVAGGAYGYSGDGGPATSAALGAVQPYNGLAIDPAGNLYISDDYNHAIRMVNAATGIITTIAGNGTPGYLGDGGPATKAHLWYPAGICFDSAGNLYIADEFNYRVRKVNTAGIISTVAGNGNATLNAVDGVQATATAVETPHAVPLTAPVIFISRKTTASAEWTPAESSAPSPAWLPRHLDSPATAAPPPRLRSSDRLAWLSIRTTTSSSPTIRTNGSARLTRLESSAPSPGS